MTILPFTSLFAAAFAVALVALSFPVSLRRVKVGDMVGDGTDETLHRHIRAQGNFIEYVPLGVITLGLVEAHAAPALMVVGIGATLALGRLLHAIGMLRGSGARARLRDDLYLSGPAFCRRTPRRRRRPLVNAVD